MIETFGFKDHHVLTAHDGVDLSFQASNKADTPILILMDSLRKEGKSLFIRAVCIKAGQNYSAYAIKSVS